MIDGQFGGSDLTDVHKKCDSNVWKAKTYATATPRCTTAGGQQVPPVATPGPALSSPAQDPNQPPLGNRPVPPGV